MAETIWGNVTKILSTKSFEMDVTHQKPENKESYSNVEIIEFTETNIQSIAIDEENRTVEQIARGLKDKFIMCEISGRNEQNQLVCKVSHSGAGGY